MDAFLPIIAVSALVLLSAASFRLNRAAQPLRLEFAEKSEKLIANPKLPAHRIVFIKALQNMAFGSRVMLIFSALAIPFFALAIVIFPALVDYIGKRYWIECEETRAQFDEVNRLHDRIMFFNNPILMFVVVLEAMIFFAPAILLYAIFRGALSVRVNLDAALTLVEEKSMLLRAGLPKFSIAS